MAVLAEALNVVVPRSALDAKYPGGAKQYEHDCPNATFCMDAHLTRVGFMAPPDVERYAGLLMHRGLTFFDGHQFVDMAVVDEFQGVTAPCPWLKVGRHPAGFSAVWLSGTEPGPVMHPPGWRPGRSRFNFVPNAEAPDRLLRVARDGALDVLLDYKTGREVSIARMYPGEDP